MIQAARSECLNGGNHAKCPAQTERGAREDQSIFHGGGEKQVALPSGLVCWPVEFREGEWPRSANLLIEFEKPWDKNRATIAYAAFLSHEDAPLAYLRSGQVFYYRRGVLVAEGVVMGPA